MAAPAKLGLQLPFWQSGDKNSNWKGKLRPWLQVVLIVEELLSKNMKCEVRDLKKIVGPLFSEKS